MRNFTLTLKPVTYKVNLTTFSWRSCGREVGIQICKVTCHLKKWQQQVRCAMGGVDGWLLFA